MFAFVNYIAIIKYLATVTFELLPTLQPTSIPQFESCPQGGDVLTSNLIADDLTVSIDINCKLNVAIIDITYNTFNDNWFGIVFSNSMIGDAMIYTTGKFDDRIAGLYCYHIIERRADDVIYNSSHDWIEILTEIKTDINTNSNEIHLIYQQDLSKTPWNIDTNNIIFKYAIGNDLNLNYHQSRSDIAYTLYLSPVSDIIVNTSQPTLFPSNFPTISPSDNPTNNPSLIPTISPSVDPTNNPSLMPTRTPTVNPTNPPSISPTIQPTDTPTSFPTNNPTLSPSNTITSGPTDIPTLSPSIATTKEPTKEPSKLPTTMPTSAPLDESLCSILQSDTDVGIFKASISAGDLSIIAAINCEKNVIMLDITYHNFGTNWFGIIFNDRMTGYALVYTTGKDDDRIEGLYAYDITNYSPEGVIYDGSQDWTDIEMSLNRQAMHIICEQELRNIHKDILDINTKQIMFRYAIGNSLSLRYHRSRSDDTFNLNFEPFTEIPTSSPSTMFPLSQPTMTPTTKISDSPSSSPSQLPVFTTINESPAPTELTLFPIASISTTPWIEIHSTQIIDCEIDGGECVLDCKDEYCLRLTYNCGENTTCIINVFAENGLENVAITGKANSELIINCTNASCDGANINASLAKTVTLDCRGNNRFCGNVQLYCPPFTVIAGTKTKNCQILGL